MTQMETVGAHHFSEGQELSVRTEFYSNEHENRS